MIIDFHTHSFPDKIAASAIAKMQLDCHSAAFSAGTVDALRTTAREAGIDISLVQPVATNPAKVASMNDISIAGNGVGGLMYFGCMHPDCPEYAEELRRIHAAGLKGIKIHPVYQGADSNAIRYLRSFEVCAELGMWVLTHAGDDIGFPGAVRCSPEMCRDALSHVPELKLIAAHMGGWRNWDWVADNLADTGAYIDTAFSLGSITPHNDGYYDGKSTALRDEEEFCALVKAFGSRRVIFGTDTPWTNRASELGKIRALPLREGEIADILGNNAERILFG
ncbi:MAG: amidohydrolase family protein [Oscillospiraceae bacterium]|nr:amidohydrolase family protein [Oscillospiraceae bacterium]